MSSRNESLRRLAGVFRLDFFYTLRRPMTWTLLALLALLSWGMSTGNVQISSGDSRVGGTKAWITSEFSTAFVLAIMITSLYLFFLAIAAGMQLMDDDEAKIGEVLHATPLTPGEYVWGKALAMLAAFGVVLAAHLAMMAFFNHLRPDPGAADIRGPFEALNYLRPALVFALPSLLFYHGVAFYLGARLRRPAWVFVFPLAVGLVTGFFLWNWNPTWLDPAIDRALMLIDPSGFRWLDQTWIQLDRGADFYNVERVGLDAGFVVSRLVLALIGALGIVGVHRHVARTLGGRAEPKPSPAAIEELLARPPEAATAPLELEGVPAMRTRPRRALAVFAASARTEIGALLREPALYLFAFFVVLQTLGNSLVSLGAFGTPLLLTPGQLAVDSANMIVFLVCLLLMFFVAGSLERERGARLDSLAYSAPLATAPLVLGKLFANLVLGVAITVAVLIGCVIALAVQGRVAIELWPFALVWGAILGPTFVAWIAFVAFVYSLTGNRYATYGVSLGVVAYTLYKLIVGEMNWVGNWMPWGVLRWSDISLFELDRQALLLNRAMVLAAGAFFLVLALRLFPRRSFDATRILERLAPRALGDAALRALPWALPALALGTALFFSVHQGPGGEATAEELEDYWKQNFATWEDAPEPALRAVEVELDVEPEKGRLASSGRFLLENPHADELRRFALSGGLHWEDLAWTLGGAAYEPEERSGLYVFTPERPLAPGERVEVGFSFRARYPDGPTKNGEGAPEFVLPSGVVLTSFRPSFVPLLGYLDEVGVDDDNRLEPPERPDDYYLEELPPFTGTPYGFTTRVTITAPEDFTFHSVGVLDEERVADGRRTTVWVSDHPVRFFNVVGGRWARRDGEGTTIFYHPGHAYNVDEMGEVLDAARRHFSEWFYPYPWRELRLSEFPAMASYAQGFPTNITFSESIGFLTKGDDRTNAVALVTAHEAAHQWWGNLLTPGDGPGGNVLSEGMAHFSTALLIEQVDGERAGQEFRKRIEERYGERRRKDAERPLVKIDGSAEGDTTVTYDRGGWVAWMLMQHLGREAMLAGLRSFIDAYKDGPDHPLIEDLVEHLRPYAADAEAYDAFVGQWIFGMALPEYRLHRPELRAEGDRWRAVAEVENAGSGRMPVVVAATRGERFTDDGSPDPGYREARRVVWLDAGDRQPVEIVAGFEPERLVIDPDVEILQLRRASATAEL